MATHLKQSMAYNKGSIKDSFYNYLKKKYQISMQSKIERAILNSNNGKLKSQTPKAM